MLAERVPSQAVGFHLVDRVHDGAAKVRQDIGTGLVEGQGEGLFVAGGEVLADGIE
ncbi:MAG: hypothetical protein AAGD22_12145 [Verrucomicrobiota bacterium]